jgi:hypothetical protein
VCKDLARELSADAAKVVVELAQREDSRYLDATTVNFEFLVSHYKAVLEYLRAKGA